MRYSKDQIDHWKSEWEQSGSLILGRKNYLFAGSHEGAQCLAMMNSFLGLCTVNVINPATWL